MEPINAEADMMETTSLSSESSSTFHTSLPSESIVLPYVSNEGSDSLRNRGQTIRTVFLMPFSSEAVIHLSVQASPSPEKMELPVEPCRGRTRKVSKVSHWAGRQESSQHADCSAPPQFRL